MATFLKCDFVDPLGVISLTSLDYVLTLETVALIRRLDQRPFPFFGLNAVDEMGNLSQRIRKDWP